MFKLNVKFDADSLLYVPSHFKCDSHTLHKLTLWCPPPTPTRHWLVQWTCLCSGTCSPEHSPWLPGYIDVMQTILSILTVAGIFWTNLIYSFEFVFWDSSDTSPEVELLGHKAVLFLIFWGNSILLSTVAAPICIPTKVPEGSIFLLIHWWEAFWQVWGDSSLWFNVHFFDD